MTYEGDINKFIDLVCERSEVDLNMLIGKNRSINGSLLRQCMWKKLIDSGMTLVRVGKYFDRHYSTIISGVRHINDLIKTYDVLAMSYMVLVDKVYEDWKNIYGNDLKITIFVIINGREYEFQEVQKERCNPRRAADIHADGG